MKFYAVIDTNVLVAALLSKNEDSATVVILREIFGGRITPLFHERILKEYFEVLHRKKFRLNEQTIRVLLNAIVQFGIEIFPKPTGEILPDADDLIFYEVAAEFGGAFLVTENKKHFPAKKFIVTPAEMVRMILDVQAPGF